jgi:hypothetical protein
MCYFPGMNHDFQDAVSLELARRVADGIPSHPEWIELARANLERWMKLNEDSPSLVRCYKEWLELLDRPLPEIRALLTEATDRGQRIRQNSPFAGALPYSEVWAVKEKLRRATPTP